MQVPPALMGIFARTDPAALGAVAALEKAGKLGQVKIVGFDGMPEGKQAIKAGKIYADPIQFPDRLGRESVQGIVKYPPADHAPPTLPIPPPLYTPKTAR